MNDVLAAQPALLAGSQVDDWQFETGGLHDPAGRIADHRRAAAHHREVSRRPKVRHVTASWMVEHEILNTSGNDAAFRVSIRRCKNDWHSQGFQSRGQFPR